MTDPSSNRLGELFDPKAELLITGNFRPHWSQAGAVVFVTFRTADSIPKQVLQRWNRDKEEWIRRKAGQSNQRWSDRLPTLEPNLQRAFRKEFDRCREDFLDTCQGACVLRRKELARVVADTLMHFDGERYRMGDFVVMPNHVHVLAAFASERTMVSQFDSWLHFSAREINRLLGRKGKFWQQEPFDHLVRSPEQYSYLRQYIHDNGAKARLPESDYLLRIYPDAFSN